MGCTSGAVLLRPLCVPLGWNCQGGIGIRVDGRSGHVRPREQRRALRQDRMKETKVGEGERGVGGEDWTEKERGGKGPPRDPTGGRRREPRKESEG